MCSEEHFGAAVRDALKHFVEPDRLRENPLTGSRMVDQVAGGQSDQVHRTLVLRQLISGACERLAAAPKTADLARVLERTYLFPERSHNAAAAALGLSERTYRRWLNRAVTLLTAWLWEEETEARVQLATAPADEAATSARRREEA
jgi:hypothetical protein